METPRQGIDKGCCTGCRLAIHTDLAFRLQGFAALTAEQGIALGIRAAQTAQFRRLADGEALGRAGGTVVDLGELKIRSERAKVVIGEL